MRFPSSTMVRSEPKQRPTAASRFTDLRKEDTRLPFSFSFCFSLTPCLSPHTRYLCVLNPTTEGVKTDTEGRFPEHATTRSKRNKQLCGSNIHALLPPGAQDRGDLPPTTSPSYEHTADLVATGEFAAAQMLLVTFVSTTAMVSPRSSQQS